ncbi:MAG TPA: DUF177 domain-containing protein [Gaiella sp.]|nr:DUF177 domain-containing protein [Gaiella sp.]
MARFPLRRLRLRPGEEHRETVPLAVEPFELGGERYDVTPDPLAAELAVQRAATGDLFRLVFSATVSGPCMRCLAAASVDVDVDAREYQAADTAADEDLGSEYVVEGELDVDSWARDQIALTLPDQILHRPDCAGLCPVCGKDLNVEPHIHDDETVDPRWAALEALRSDEDQPQVSDFSPTPSPTAHRAPKVSD